MTAVALRVFSFIAAKRSEHHRFHGNNLAGKIKRVIVGLHEYSKLRR
jgi:hypothetical protein